MNILFQILIGFLLADIITGHFHWFEDSYLDYCIDIPIISEISKDNELHHYFPRSILAYNYIEHTYVPFMISIIIIFILYLTNKKFIVKYPFLMLSVTFFGITGNIIHRFSHMRDCENNFIVKFLQYIGLFCSHSHHSLHHSLISQKYCVMSQYNNYILDTINYWRGLESIIYLITNTSPTRKKAYDDYYIIHNYMHENAKLECPDKPTKKDVEELTDKLKKYKKCQ